MRRPGRPKLIGPTKKARGAGARSRQHRAYCRWRGSSVGLMGRVDRERALAEGQREMAKVEQAYADDHDKNEHVHFRAMKAHERSAEIHDAIAALLPRDD